jgi:vacuolar-type H+-ATPase subunit H
MSSAQTMKIFSIINRIKQELEESPRSKFGGGNKRVVEVDRLLDLLEDLKVVIPEDIRRATGILSEAENTIADAKENAVEIVEQAHQEADTILGQAQSQADSIRADARAEFEHRVGESEVYKEAFTRASGIAAEAEENATAIYNGARKYADEILVDLQRYLAEYHQMIEANRKELGVDDISLSVPVPAPARAPEPQYASQAQYTPAQPPVVEQPRFVEPAYSEPARYQEAYSEPPRQQRPQHPAADRYAVEEDPTATRQFARPVSRPMPAEEMEEAPRRRDPRVEEAPPKKKGLFSRLLEAEDDDDEDEDDEDWEEAPKPAKEPKEKKPRKRLIEFIESDDDEDEDEDF